MTVQRILLLQRPIFRLRSSSLTGPGRCHSSSSAKQEPADKGCHDEVNISKSADKLPCTVLEATEVQNKVGKSWKYVSGLFTKVKDALMSPPVSNQHGVEKFGSKVEPGETKSKAKLSGAEVSEDGELYGLRTHSKDFEPPATFKAGKISKIETLCEQIKNAKQSEEKGEGYPHGLLFGTKENLLVGGKKHNVLGLIDSMSNVPIPREHQILRLPTTAKKKLRNSVSTKTLSGPSGVKENSTNLEVASSKTESVSGVEINVAISGSNSRADNLHSQTGEEGTKGVCYSMMSDDVQGPSRGVPCSEVSIPGIIGDPDVPVALVKHPTRTIKISNLSCVLMLDQLEEALEIGAGNVSLISLGPASSVAYAEFKTEEAKEEAIAKQSIKIEGKMVKMYRIDNPRTTVVRIRLGNEKNFLATLHQICKKHGEVSKFMQRASRVADVYFELHEWPNMLNILNSLNGMEVCGHRVVALPAPVYPKDIIQLLWKQQEGRKHVKSVVRSLVKRINSSTGSTELMNKVYECYI